MRRSHTANTPVRERRSNVMFFPETETSANVSGFSRASNSPAKSAGSQRVSSVRNLSVVEASRHRLSIRKSAAFPMQQTAPKPFLTSCADITRHGRDWNAEFQLAWEMEDNTVSQAESRLEALRRVEREFVADAVRTVKQIVTLDDDGPREMPKFLQCYRVDNIFFRVLPDSRSGRNYVASLRGVLQSRTRLLTVPLSCMLFYRGMPVLAQALVPMPRQPTQLYGAGYANNHEVEAEILHMADALNIPFPDGTLEVYEGLDGRFYLTNSNSTLTPLFVDDTIMKRQEMLRFCSQVSDGHNDTLSVLDNIEVLDSIVRACVDSESRSIVDCLKNVSEILHSFGVNLCLLKQVMRKIAEANQYDVVTLRQLNELFCVEMLARSVKQEFYLEVQGKRVAYDDEVLGSTLSRRMGDVFANIDVFQSRFLEVVAKKYGVVDEDNDIIELLTTVRSSRKADIVARVCALLGVTIEKTSGNRSDMTWHANVNARVIPQLADPREMHILAEKYRTIVTKDSHRYAFCFPVRWKVACWEGRYDEALDLVHETATAQYNRYGENAIVTLYARRSVCEVCFATMQKKCITEGRGLFPEVMKGFEELTCLVTQGRRHIEYGFWILRVALVYQQDDLVVYRSCVEEAVEHFYKAIEKLPAYLKSEHGSWLHLQPYRGLLKCKQLLPSCSVNTKELVEHSIELSTIGWASDFFMLYLWDLSLQLETEGRYEEAIRVLLTAITVSKKKPTVSLDLPTLMLDAAHIYRSWDQEKYCEHSLTLLREAAEKAIQLFGVRSREYAVILNNKGAMEIELNRLTEAGDSLEKAGVAFEEAGVAQDDSDYKTYLDNLVYLEQRLSARPTVRRGFLQRFPFLANTADEFPFSDVRPLEDDVFVGLAHQRVQMDGGTAEAKNIEQMMKERVWELFRYIQDGDILKRHPYLPAVINGIPTASLNLDDDMMFREFISKLSRSTSDAETRMLESSIRQYVVKKAEDTALQRAYMMRLEQEFNDKHGEYVNLMYPIPWLYALEDEQFNLLTDEMQKSIISQAPPAQFQIIQEKINRRVREIEGEMFEWRQVLVQWLSPSKLYSVSTKDFIGDVPLLDLFRIRRLAGYPDDTSVEKIDTLIRDKLTAMWERAHITRMCLAVDDEELHREFPFLTEMPHHQRLSTLLLHEDQTVTSIAEQLRKGSTDSRLQSEMTAAVKTIAAYRRDSNELKKWYYDIESVNTGIISLESVPMVRDDYYLELWHRRNIAKEEHEENSPLILAVTHRMGQRIMQMNSWMRKVSANGYRRRLRLEGKYPFLTRRHRGYTLDALDIEDDEEFMSIVKQRQQLIASSDAVHGDIERLSRRANKRVEKIASHRVKQLEQMSKRYPFIPSKLEGVETVTIRLEDNETFAEKAAYYSRLRESGSSETEVRCRRLAREMENIAIATAREIRIREWRECIEREDLHERYPFLPEEPARGVLLGDVCPVQQPEFRELSNKLDELRQDPTRHATEISSAEEAMTALVVRLAEERAEATEAAHGEYPFLPRRVLGIRLGDLPLNEDELFATAAKEGVEGKESLLQSRVVQIAACHNLNDAQLADNDDAVLAQHPYLVYTSRKCFPLRHLPLNGDVVFNQRLEEYEDLMQQPFLDEDATASIRFLLASRADELALQEIERIELLKRTFVALEPLSLEDLRHLQDRREFQTFSDDSAANISGVLLEDAKRSIMEKREDRAAKIREVDALRKAYPILGRNVDPSMLENPVIAKLVDDHEELMNDFEGNAAMLQKLEEEIAQHASEHNIIIKGEQGVLERPHSPNAKHAVDISFNNIEEDLMDDEYYQELIKLQNTVKERNNPEDAPLLRRIKAQIDGRKRQLRNDAMKQIANNKRMSAIASKRFPFLMSQQRGIPLYRLHLDDDDEIRKYERERDTYLAQKEQNTADIDKIIHERTQELACALQEEESSLEAMFPFLGKTVKGLPLRALSLMADSAFAKLAAQYTSEEVSSGDAAERSRLEQEMRDQAGRIARDVRMARRRDGVRGEDLHERYPFLPEEPARGVLLGDVCPVQQPEFRELSNKLDELRQDPTRHATEISSAEEAMTALVVRLAEERAEATEAAHGEYPFLPRRVLGIRLGDLPLNEDEEFSRLARRRARQRKNPKTVKDAHATEEEMIDRARALAHLAKLVDRDRGDANEYVRARNPFLLYEDRKCVVLSEIPLFGDIAYQKLFCDRLDALEDAEANAPLIAKLEEELRTRADELALVVCERDLILKKYSFLSFDSAPGWLEALQRDLEFQQLCARYDELNLDPVKNADALRELEEAMRIRSEVAAQALREAEVNDAEEQKMRGKHPSDSDAASIMEGMNGQGSLHPSQGGHRVTLLQQGSRLLRIPTKQEQPLSDYSFLPDPIDGVALSELYLEDDPYFQELLAKYNELVSGGRRPGMPLAKQLYEQLFLRAKQLAADEKKVHTADERIIARVAAQHPYLELGSDGAVLWTALEADDEFCTHLHEYHEESGKRPSEENRKTLREKEAALDARAQEVARALQEEESSLEAMFPFLGKTVKGLPLRALSLMADSAFAKLAAQYTSEEVSSGDAAERSRLEQEMRDQAGRIARDVRMARRRDGVRGEDLHERYPFLPEEPARGVLLGDVCPVQQPEFRELSNKLDELRQDPTRHATEISSAEEAMTALVVRLAEERAEATEAAHGEYPFLPRRVLGIRLGDLPLNEDEEFSRLARRRARQRKNPKTVKDAHATEEEMIDRARALAHLAKLVDRDRGDANEYVRARNPFLLYEDRKCVVLSEIPLFGDIAYQKLFCDRLDALEDAEANAPLIAKLEEELRTRADELALVVCERDLILKKYSFLSFDSVPGWLEALQRDLEFQQLCARYDELNLDPVKNADALRELEEAMKIRSEVAAQALREAEVNDAEEQKMRGKHPSDSDAASIMEGMNGQGESTPKPGGTPGDTTAAGFSITADSDKGGKFYQSQAALHSTDEGLKQEQPLSDYSFLPDPIDGVALSELYLEDDPYFQELLAKYNELVSGGRRPGMPLAKQLYEQLFLRAKQLAADEKKVHTADERIIARVAAQHPYLELGSDGAVLWTALEADDEFCTHLHEYHEESGKRPSEENRKTLREKEAALDARAQEVARALQEEESSLEAMFPFLGKTVKGLPLRALSLMADSAFAKLAAQYTSEEVSSGDAAERSRLEQEMRDQAGRIARDVRMARRRDGVRGEDLHERYPFLPEEPARGVLLGDVCPVQQPEFRELSNKLDELRQDPTRHATEISSAEEAMTALVVRLAEERAEATEAAHGEYPFLPRRVLGIRLGDLPLNEDEEFSRLARRRARQRKNPKTVKDAHATEEEMIDRARALAHLAKLVDRDRGDANEYVRARNPFLLYEDRKCVVLSEIPLFGDIAYQKLFCDRLDALEDAEANAPLIAKLEEELRTRADELALVVCERDLILKKYSFLSFDSVPGWLEALQRDLEFQQLCARYDELNLDPVKNADALRELEEAMKIRSEVAAQALREAEVNDAEEQEKMRGKHPSDSDAASIMEGMNGQGESTPKPGGTPGDTTAAGFSITADSDKGGKFYQSQAALHSTDEGLKQEQPLSDYSFLPDPIDGVALSELYLEDDPYFQELLAKYNELVSGGRRPGMPLAKQLYEQLFLRAKQLAADEKKVHTADERIIARVAAQHPYLELGSDGAVLWTALEADDEFCTHLHEYHEESGKRPSEENRKTLREKEAALDARAQEVARALQEEESSLEAMFPFLGKTVKGLPLRALSLMADSAFAKLAAQYTSEEVSSGDAAERSRLEQEMRDQAGRIARDVRMARRRDGVRGEDLHERYPFLPEEPARGVLLGDVCPVQQPEFRELSNKLDELRQDPTRHATEISSAEEAMTALVVRLAEERAEATEAAHGEYPFLPRRVLGIRLGDLPLNEDEEFSRLARRRARQRKNPKTVKDAHATEEEMIDRARALAHLAKLVDRDRGDANEYVRARNPFLLYEDRKCVVLSEIPLFGDIAYQKLFCDRLDALEDAEANAPLIAKLEEELRTRADELALVVCERDLILKKYSFLSFDSVPGWLEALQRDLEFQQLCARYDELNLDPVKNADALRELEEAMKIRSEVAAQALREAEVNDAEEQEKLRVQFPMCPDVPAILQANSEFMKLTQRRSTLLSDPEANARAIAALDRSAVRCVSMHVLACDETAIEFCQEDEVMSFDVTVKRSTLWRRRARVFGSSEIDDVKKATGMEKEAGDEERDLSASKEITIGSIEAYVDTAQANLLAFFSSLGDDETRARESLEREEELERLVTLTKGIEMLETLYREWLMQEEVMGVLSVLAEHTMNGERKDRSAIEEEQAISVTKLKSEMEKDMMRALETAELQAQEAREAFCTDESLRREELQRTETEERGALNVEAVQIPEHLDRENVEKSEAEEREKLRVTAVEGEKAVIFLDDLNGVLGTEMRERSKIECEEIDESKNLLQTNLFQAEMYFRQLVEKNAEDVFISIRKSLDEWNRQVEVQMKQLQEVVVAERDERRSLVEEEKSLRDKMLLNEEEEVILMERTQRMTGQQLDIIRSEEEKRQSDIEKSESEEWELLKLQSQAELTILKSVADLLASEHEARYAIVNGEEENIKALLDEVANMEVHAKYAQEEREAEEQEVQQKKRKQDATTLLKSVVFAYRTRRRLANRFVNRKVHEYKNAFANTLRTEFMARNAISNAERGERQQIYETRDALVSSMQKLSNKSLTLLEKEEDDARHQLIDDCMFQLGQLQRASRKLFAKQYAQPPSLKDLQEFEERQNGIGSEAVNSTAKTKITPLKNEQRDMNGDEGIDDDEVEEDDAAVIESGKYKGYVLDPIGTFLLQYERDLRRFRAFLERSRQIVAVEHDLLKKARDTATQEMVHGGTGALWIPARPLPLSDLVRGPSAQYRRGRIVDARGQRPSRMTDVSGRIVTPTESPPSFEGFVRQGRPF
ncbi:CLU domain [Trypanosoma melophagium]|uniref:CLU domain n=1 Tax=Trypanosoma melophagium TaxID=715481 RepID=UPI003519E801|nr:CLU domain [Trypanosoma melophagium]